MNSITRRALLAGIGVTTATILLPTLALAVPLSTPAASVLWGVYMNGVPWDMAPLYTLEREVAKGVSIIHFGEAWQIKGREQGFPWNDIARISAHGSIPMVAWQPWDSSVQSSGAPNSPQWRCSTVTAGTYDSYITRWATDARTSGKRFFLRLAHEMNGTWRFPWAEQINGNQPGDYVRMWRHVHDIFTAVGVPNATWVWNPNVHSSNSIPMAQVYPGDAYVDWTALDGYNWGTDVGNGWQTFEEVFTSFYGGPDSYQEVLRIAPSKPIMICETATSVNGGNAAAWITDALVTQLPMYFPKIRAVVWFDTNGGDSRYTWPIDASASGLAAFKSGIGDPRYGHNQFGWWSSTGKVLPIG